MSYELVERILVAHSTRQPVPRDISPGNERLSRVSAQGREASGEGPTAKGVTPCAGCSRHSTRRRPGRSHRKGPIGVRGGAAREKRYRWHSCRVLRVEACPRPRTPQDIRETHVEGRTAGGRGRGLLLFFERARRGEPGALSPRPPERLRVFELHAGGFLLWTGHPGFRFSGGVGGRGTRETRHHRRGSTPEPEGERERQRERAGRTEQRGARVWARAGAC